MSAIKLADELRYEIINHCLNSAEEKWYSEIETMLRQQEKDLKWAREQWGKDRINLIHQLDSKDNKIQQQQQEIADLKIANQDLKYQLIQKSGEQVLNDFKELSDEEIIDAWKKFPNWGHEQHITMFGKELLKKANEK
jgi:hypothetical protein